MNYYIVYEAVKKKASTDPPNLFIGNVEMAAAIGLVLNEQKYDLDLTQVETPIQIQELFLKHVEEMSNADLSEQSKVLIDLTKQYQVKQMVNETLDNLKDLAKHQL